MPPQLIEAMIDLVRSLLVEHVVAKGSPGDIRAGQSLYRGFSPLSTLSSRERWVLERTDRISRLYDDERAEALIAEALDGDADADAVLCEIATELIADESVIPSRLQKYVVAKLRNTQSSLQ